MDWVGLQPNGLIIRMDWLVGLWWDWLAGMGWLAGWAAALHQAESRAEVGDWEIAHNLGVCHLYLK